MYQIYKKTFIVGIITLMAVSCGIYSFTGSSIPIGVETFQVDYFENTAGGKPGSTIEPGLDRDFTIALQDLIVNQTSLNLVNEGGDIIYSGEIIEYSVTPMASTAELKAAQNRLTMAVMVNYENVLNEEDNIEICIESVKKFFISRNINYEHIIFSRNTLKGQIEIEKMQGKNNIFYAGAYLGYGFHEDGFESGARVSTKINNILND